MASGASVNKHRVAKAIAFPLGFLLLLFIASYLFQPVWTSWNNYSTFHGFYEEPENTIETVFLGPSSTITGITPMELYEDYGICSYNLSSEQQPLLASYYWLCEAYRFHSESLKTVVLSCVELSAEPDIAFYRKAIDAMRPSALKYQAVKDYAGLHEGVEEAPFYYFPLLGYHDRWSSLGIDDFLKSKYPVEKYTRGYLFSMGRYMDSQSYASMAMQPYAYDPDATPNVPNEEALGYLGRMVEFCNEKGIRLVLASTPCSGGSAQHKMVSAIAEEKDLEYLDFDCQPIAGEVGFNRATDTSDGGHPNYYGAEKMTRWIGEYLRENCGATDVRGTPRYAFMDEELEQYRREVLDVVELKEQRELCGYLECALQNDDYAVFLAVRDDGSSGLSKDGAREALAAMGLERLSALGLRESYLALFERGTLVFEATNGKMNASRVGRLQNGRPYNMNSGGADSVASEVGAPDYDETQKGVIASCIIDGAERAANARGVNIVVYNERTNAVVDSAVFDTYLSTRREAGYLPDLLEESEGKPFAELSGNLQKLSLYGHRCSQEEKIERALWGGADGHEEERENGEAGDFLSLLEAFGDDGNVSVFITTKGDAASLLDGGARSRLEAMGLSALASLEEGEAYIGVLQGGEVCLEESGVGVIRADYENARLCSGGDEPDAESYIMTDNARKDVAEPGISMVLYDKYLKMVIYAGKFLISG